MILDEPASQDTPSAATTVAGMHARVGDGLMSSPHALYRFYDETGQLLYVGISVNPGARFAQHRSDKPWWGEAVDIKVQPMPSRDAALAAEEEAIKNERPIYNIVHNASGDLGDDDAGERLLNVIDGAVLDRLVTVLGGDMVDTIRATQMLNATVGEYRSDLLKALAEGLPATKAHVRASYSAQRAGDAYLLAILNRRRRDIGEIAEILGIDPDQEPKVADDEPCPF